MLDLNKYTMLVGVGLICVLNMRYVVPVLPTDPEHVLSKALCGSVAASSLTQIRKYAAAQGGKASNSAVSTHMQRWK